MSLTLFLAGRAPLANPKRSASRVVVPTAPGLSSLRWAARWLWNDDADWFEGGCGDIAVLLEEFARRVGIQSVKAVGGMTGPRRDPVPHAWLDVGGQTYDPRADVEGLRYSGYKPSDTLGLLVSEWPESDEDEYGDRSRIARLMSAFSCLGDTAAQPLPDEATLASAIRALDAVREQDDGDPY